MSTTTNKPSPATADPVRRSAARVATVVAVPMALLVVAVSVFTYGRLIDPPRITGPAPTGPVTMTAPDLAPEMVGVCATVVANLPDTVGGRARRPVSAGSEQNAAYGEPPVTVACGTALPPVQPTDDVLALSGVCWLAVDRSGSVAYTTVDRTVPVTVTVPGPAAGSAQSVVPFSAAIGLGDPPRDTYPSGCRP